MKDSAYRASLVVLPILALALASCASAPDSGEDSSPRGHTKPSYEIGESAYGHFLFTTFAGKGENALILAEVQDSRFRRQEVARAKWLGFPVCVRRGFAYFKHLDTVYSVDLETGKRHSLPSTGTCSFAGNCLYSATRRDGALTIRSYDFEKQAYRDVQVARGHFQRTPNERIRRLFDVGFQAQKRGRAEADIAKLGVHDKDKPDSIAISPDGTRLAFFEPVQPAYIGGFVLAIVDLAEATITYTGPVVDYHYSSSKMVSFPPYLWLDNDHVLVVQNHPGPAGSIGSAWLSSLDLRTGELRDVAEIPCPPTTDYIHLIPPSSNSPTHLETAGRRYRVDTESNTLEEYDGSKPEFTLVRRDGGTEVRHDGQLVSRVVEHDPATGNCQRIEEVLPSPDGVRACMVVYGQRLMGRTLKFYDVAQGKVRIVRTGLLQHSSLRHAGGSHISGWMHWVSDADLQKRARPPGLDKGWTPF